ncbi:MAG: DJ-1 family protein [Chitinivibrionales bacterium]|nr:DJ-1 family protein [Chitinivibrionales bacterium]MBD3358224.1 DJ-1 family protein [Chitinivibrionales bacterium]
MTMSALIPVANGNEEIETVCLIDIARRAGMDVTVASVDQQTITASRGVRIIADTSIEECKGTRYDLIAVPGGTEGARRLSGSQRLAELLERQAGSGRLFGAICAAPALVLEPLGLLEGRRATCHPNLFDSLRRGIAVEERVVVDGNCVTSRGPGTAIEFALTLVEILFSDQKAKELADAMVVRKRSVLVQ